MRELFVRSVVCTNCNESVAVPDDVATAHCVRCGQALTDDPLAHAIQPAPQSEYQPAEVTKPDQPLGYSTWDDFRANSPAVQRELLALLSRPMPDVRSLEPLPVPEDAPRELDTWGRPIGTFALAADNRVLWWSIGALLIAVGLLLHIGAGLTIAANRQAPRQHVVREDFDTKVVLVLLFGFVCIAVGAYSAFFRGVGAPTVVWIFEEGVFLHHQNQARLVRWEDIYDFETIAEAGRLVYRLTVEEGMAVNISVMHSPEVMPLVEYVEIRLCAAQFLHRLRAIWEGGREVFGIVTIDRQGLMTPRFFAAWPEVRRVVSDATHVFVDWSQRPEWVPLRREHVSLPSLLIAVSSVLVDEHARLFLNESVARPVIEYRPCEPWCAPAATRTSPCRTIWRRCIACAAGSW